MAWPRKDDGISEYQSGGAIHVTMMIPRSVGHFMNIRAEAVSSASQSLPITSPLAPSQLHKGPIQ